MKLICLLFLMASVLLGSAIGPLTPTASELVATGGDVIVYFAGHTASFESVLNLIDPVAVGPFFPNQTTPVGTSFNLGNFASGTVLRFRMDVLTTGLSFFTGPGSSNPDGLIHVAHAGWASDAVIPVNGTLVGFEDILGGGDGDYDDNTFVFTNVRTGTVPEPSTFGVVGAALAIAAGAAKRRMR